MTDHQAVPRGGQGAQGPVSLPAGVGTVTMQDGEPTTDDLGFAVRAGLADPSPEWAAQLFPLFELAQGEHRPEPGEVFEDLAVFCWVDSGYVAGALGVSVRTVRDWTARGVPHRSGSRSRQYPVPHVFVWEIEYALELRDLGRCEWLAFAVALARRRLREAERAARRGAPRARRPARET